METTYTLDKLDQLNITDIDTTWMGASVEWFDEERRSHGSVAAVAATMTLYLARTRENCQALCPSKYQDKRKVLALMDDYWDTMSPGRRGVRTLYTFCRALTLQAKEAEIEDLPIRQLDIPRFKIARPTVDQCVAFIRAGLEGGSPVVWLNLHSGRISRLPQPQWYVITGLSVPGNGPIVCTYLRDNREKSVDFRLWFQSTRVGGGLVYLPKE